MRQPVREPAVAGSFYPEAAGPLQTLVQTYLSEAVAEGPAPKAIIAPHAGYVYSGPVAASAYALLAPVHDSIERVVLLGPSHRVAFDGVATSSARFFRTPLGAVPLDGDGVRVLADLRYVLQLDEAHRQEHSLEVHLPFLQTVLDAFRLIPLVVGQAGPEEVGTVLERLWGGTETLIVISSDLSHYLDYESARRVDAATSRAIEGLRPDRIGYEDACGRAPVRGLLTVARRKGLSVETLDLRNSGDTAGPHERVVGYGAFVFR